MKRSVKYFGAGMFLLLFAFVSYTRSHAEDTPKRNEDAAKIDSQDLNGVWLVDVMEINKQTRMSSLWNSKLTIKNNSFTLTKVEDADEDLTGTISLGKSENSKTIDLKLAGLDLSKVGESFNIPATILPGIYKLEKDKLTVCVGFGGGKSAPERPTQFQSHGLKTVLFTFRRADASFKDLSKEITIKVIDPDGKPVKNANVFILMTFQADKEKDDDTWPQWQYHKSVMTDHDGIAKYHYDNLHVIHTISVRHSERKLCGHESYSPFKLQSGKASIQLSPECKLIVNIESPELQKRNEKLGWTIAELQHHGSPIATNDSSSSSMFEFFVAPGTYSLETRGENLRRKTIKVTVPENQSELLLDPIQLPATNLALLKGKPAPEFDSSVVGWKGEKVKLSDLKGKYVLVDFWGYWCAPCVGAMPVLIELHEKYHDKGLAIVGVHLDLDGEVDSVEKLDEKTAKSKQELWKGKELPFPIALTCGTFVNDEGDEGRGGVAKQYGIMIYPTTVLIDREGKVVGDFSASDIKEASAEIEKLLGLKEIKNKSENTENEKKD